MLEYNSINNTKYNLFEFLYIMANGLTGDNPLIYNYDLYAFGLILRQLVDVYTESLEKNLLFDPRKYRAKKTRKRGGSPLKKSNYYLKQNYIELENINTIINNMINPDCIYRWNLYDIISQIIDYLIIIIIIYIKTFFTLQEINA